MPAKSEHFISVNVLMPNLQQAYRCPLTLVVNDNTLINAGQGIAHLPVEELTMIRHLFLSSTHWEHSSHLPLLTQTQAENPHSVLSIYGQKETLTALVAQLSANATQTPKLHLVPTEIGDVCALSQTLITALPAEQSTSALSWLIEGPKRAMAYTGDGGKCHSFWKWLERVPSLSDVVCETESHISLPQGWPEQNQSHIQVWLHHYGYRQYKQKRAASQSKKHHWISLNQLPKQRRQFQI